MLVGLKSSINPEEIRNRERFAPPCYEFYIRKTDSENEIQEAIEHVLGFTGNLVLHQPNDFDANKDQELNLQLCRKCVRLAEKNDLYGVVVHPLPEKKDTLDLWAGLDSDKVMVENLTHDYFRTMKQMLESPFPRIVFDVCHAFMVCKNNDAMMEWIEALGSRVSWMHLADSDGETHGQRIGRGKIDWSRVKRLDGKGIVEVVDENEVTAEEKIGSYLKLKWF